MGHNIPMGLLGVRSPLQLDYLGRHVVYLPLPGVNVVHRAHHLEQVPGLQRVSTVGWQVFTHTWLELTSRAHRSESKTQTQTEDKRRPSVNGQGIFREAYLEKWLLFHLNEAIAGWIMNISVIGVSGSKMIIVISNDLPTSQIT